MNWMKMCHKLDKKYEAVRNDKQIVFTDHKSRAEYRILNPNAHELSCFMVDNGLINDNSIDKCDHSMIHCDTQRAYFIEIKGSDLLKACGQIGSTIQHLSHQMKGLTPHARIALTRVNTTALQSQEYVRFRKQMERQGGTVKQANLKLIETL